MGRDIRVKGIKRRDVDEDKLALAFLMLAKQLADETRADESAERGEREAA